MAKQKQEAAVSLKDIIIEAILDKKGQNAVTLDLRDIKDTVADYFIIVHGDSNTQVNAIYQGVDEAAREHGHRPYHSEGMQNSEWIILDYVDIVVHIFYRERRDFYLLEELWHDAKVIHHDPAAAIKPKAVRQSRWKDEPMLDEEALPARRVVASRRKSAAPRKAAAPRKSAPRKDGMPEKVAAPRKAAASRKSASDKAVAPRKAAAPRKEATPAKKASKPTTSKTSTRKK